MNKYVYLALMSLLFLSCKKENTNQNTKENLPMVVQGEAYGSTYRIIYYSEEDLNDEIGALLQTFDNSVNTYKENSYLTAFNKSEKGDIADEMLLELIEMTTAFNKKSEGYFDPSVEPLSSLWGFSQKGLKNSPSKAQVDSVLQFTGLQHLNVKGDSIIKDDPRFQLSFNSITGYINDKIADYLKEKNVNSFLIEIGGEVYAAGKKPDQSNWTIGIDEPNEHLAEREVRVAVSLENEGLATSGNYRKFHVDERTGEKVVHTINPVTGEAKSSNLLSATVIAPTTAEADALATALMAMGYNKAIAFIEKHKDLKFYLIWMDQNNKIEHKGFNNFEFKKL